MASSQSSPDVFHLVRVGADGERDATGARAPEDVHGRVHHAGWVAEPVGVQLDGGAGRGERVQRRLDLRKHGRDRPVPQSPM